MIQREKDVEHRTREVEEAYGELQRQRRELAGTAQRASEIPSSLAGDHGFGISSHEVRNWLTEDPIVDFLPADLALAGDGPFEATEFAAWLDELGFQTWEASGACDDVEVMIVGRSNWDAGAIEDHIKARCTQGIRIYSQEMFIGAIATGRDPLESGDAELLSEFARSHPALEHLGSLDPPWPNIVPIDDPPLVPGEFVEYQVETSPLRELRYRVGASGLNASRRRKILTDAFTGDLPFVHSNGYMRQWGRPRTTRRLQRMAMHIAGLISKNNSNTSYSVAVQEWTEDLAWLKRTFKELVQPFRWPEPSPVVSKPTSTTPPRLQGGGGLAGKSTGPSVGATVDLSDRCVARTQMGDRCTRPVSIVLGKTGYCAQHAALERAAPPPPSHKPLTAPKVAKPQSLPSAPSLAAEGAVLRPCPDCRAMIRRDRMADHRQRVHGRNKGMI